jgi:hypothetical protein
MVPPDFDRRESISSALAVTKTIAEPLRLIADPELLLSDGVRLKVVPLAV